MAHVETYKLKNGKKRYRVRWEATDGRAKSKSFPLAKDAQRFELEVERKAALGELYEAAPETFGDFLTGWLERYKQQVRQSSYDRTNEALRYVEPFKSIALDKINPADVEDHFHKVGLTAPRQAQIALQKLHQVLRDAQRRGHRINPSVLTVKAPRTETTEMRFLTAPQVEALANRVTDASRKNPLEPLTDYGDLIRFAARSGLRMGEIFALRDTSLDLDAGTVRIENGVYKGKLVPLKTKASRRQVDLSAETKTLLRRQLLRRKPNAMGLIFPSPEGQIINGSNFRKRVFKEACKEAGLDGLRFHDLRHTYAALMVAAGAHPKYLQAQMGHSSIRVTLDRYGHLFPDANRAILGALDALWPSSDAMEPPSQEEAL